MKENKVTILVKRAALEIDKISNPVLSEYDLTLSQYKILKFLYAEPSRTAKMVDIEKYYSLTHPTTIGLLDNLEKKGFIIRTQNPNDARSKIISLTEKADNIQDALESIGNDLEDRMTENLSSEERVQLVSLLQKLLKKEE